jgi:YD repeat-containing protein
MDVDKIVSHDGLYEINYEYEAEQYSYKSSSGYNAIVGSNTTGAAGYASSLNFDIGYKRYWYTTTAVFGHRIKRIYTPLEEVSFSYNTNRQDLGSFNTLYAKQLDQITFTTGSFCKKYVLNYGYFQDPDVATHMYEESKRLKLNSVTESSCSGSVSLPPHVFTYSTQQLPFRLSKARDHWGFHNGALSNDFLYANIPLGTFSLYTLLHSYGFGADRAVHDAYSQACMLTKIKYPTGGSHAFTYENHTYNQACAPIPTSSAIEPQVAHRMAASTYDTTAQMYTTSKIQVLGGTKAMKSANLQLTFDFTPKNAADTITKNDMLILEIYDMKGMIMQEKYPLNYNQKMSVDASAMMLKTIVSDAPYFIKLDTRCAGAALTLKISSQAAARTSTTDAQCGGLRTKSTRIQEGNNAYADILQNYTYSGGFLYYGPSYANPNQAQSVVFISSNNNPYAITGGYIGYSTVDEAKTNDAGFNNGHTIYNYFNNCQSSLWAYFYPITYPDYEPEKGMLTTVTKYKSNGDIVLKEENTYGISANPISYCVYRQGQYFNTSTMSNDYFSNVYFQKQVAALLTYKTTTRDGVITTENYTYGANHLLPRTHSITNSDGKVHTTDITYTKDITGATGAILAMQNRNILATTQQLMKTDNIIIGGDRIGYALFGTHPYAQYYDKYEVPYDYNTISWSTGTWQRQATINTVDAAVGLPTQSTLDGWSPEYLTWSSTGLLLSKSYLNHSQSFTYHVGTKLMNTNIDVDGTSMSFAYDALMRLQLETDLQRGVTKEHAYHYKRKNKLSTYSRQWIGQCDKPHLPRWTR